MPTNLLMLVLPVLPSFLLTGILANGAAILWTSLFQNGFSPSGMALITCLRMSGTTRTQKIGITVSQIAEK